MSYCVNCGVELGEAEKKCILCDCEVVNPKENVKKEVIPKYPTKTDIQTAKDNRKIYAGIISVFFLLPSAVSVVLNILYYNKTMWSIYVCGAFFILWVFIIPPVIFKNISGYLFLLFDYAAIAIFLLVIEKTITETEFFLTFALPVATFIWLYSELCVFLYNKKILYGFRFPGTGLIFTGSLSMIIDVLINLNINERFFVSWSVLVAIPTFMIGILFFLIEENIYIKEELKKRFHY